METSKTSNQPIQYWCGSICYNQVLYRTHKHGNLLLLIHSNHYNLLPHRFKHLHVVITNSYAPPYSDAIQQGFYSYHQLVSIKMLDMLSSLQPRKNGIQLNSIVSMKNVTMQQQQLASKKTPIYQHKTNHLTIVQLLSMKLPKPTVIFSHHSPMPVYMSLMQTLPKSKSPSPRLNITSSKSICQIYQIYQYSSYQTVVVP